MITPPFLKEGDKVGVVAPAKKVDEGNTLKGIDMLKSWGLQVVTGEHVFSSHCQFAGTDEQRAADFQAMIDDHEIRAIFMVRGGYGTTRIIDRIDFDPLKDHPKWIIGFSDITALHLQLFNLGITSLHAPMPTFFHALTKDSLDRLHKAIKGNIEDINVKSHTQNQAGVASGRLTGGNLSIICHTIGTVSQINTDGNILFIEDVDESLYHLDRMMVQLKRAGLLHNLVGLIAGHFTKMHDDEDDPFGKNANEIIMSHVEEFDYPVAFNFPIGHASRNYAVPVGMEMTLVVNERGAVLKSGK